MFLKKPEFFRYLSAGRIACEHAQREFMALIWSSALRVASSDGPVEWLGRFASSRFLKILRFIRSIHLLSSGKYCSLVSLDRVHLRFGICTLSK